MSSASEAKLTVTMPSAGFRIALTILSSLSSRSWCFRHTQSDSNVDVPPNYFQSHSRVHPEDLVESNWTELNRSSVEGIYASSRSPDSSLRHHEKPVEKAMMTEQDLGVSLSHGLESGGTMQLGRRSSLQEKLAALYFQENKQLALEQQPIASDGFNYAYWAFMCIAGISAFSGALTSPKDFYQGSDIKPTLSLKQSTPPSRKRSVLAGPLYEQAPDEDSSSSDCSSSEDDEDTAVTQRESSALSSIFEECPREEVATKINENRHLDIEFMEPAWTVEAVTSVLKEYGIDPCDWPGAGIVDLTRELREGQSRLCKNGGELLRVVDLVVVLVVYEPDHLVLQEFARPAYMQKIDEVSESTVS